MAQVFFGILRALFSAVEEEAIAKLKKAFPKRYVKNGRQGNARQIRTAYGWKSYYASKKAVELGHKKVLWMREGFSTWTTNGYPVEY